MDYISAREAAEKWDITQRRVEALCVNGQVQGVERVGNMWLIPKSTTKPIDGRTKAAKQQKKPIEYALMLDSERVIGMVNGNNGNGEYAAVRRGQEPIAYCSARRSHR